MIFIFFLLLISYSLSYGTISNNEKIFICSGVDILIVEGSGAYGDFSKKEKIKDFPLWCFSPVCDNKGHIYGNAFNGLNYLGLYEYDVFSQKGKVIDLVKKGAPTNYIQQIYAFDHHLLLILLQEAYLYTPQKNKIIKFPWKTKISSFCSDGKKIFFSTDNSMVISFNGKNFEEIGKYPLIKKLGYIDNSFLIGKNNKNVIINNLNTGKTLSFEADDDYKIIKLEKNYFFTNEKNKIFFFDGRKILDISSLKIFPIYYEPKTKQLVVSKNYRFYKVNYSSEIKTLTKFKISFNEYYSEIIPDYNDEHIIASGIVTQSDSLVKINLSPKAQLGSAEKLNKAIYYGFDENLNIFRGTITSLRTIKYIDVGIFGWIIVILISFVTLKVIYRRQYRLFPYLFALSLFLILLPSILFPFNLFLTGFYKYAFSSLFITVALFAACVVYDKSQRQYFEEPMYFKLFAHGSVGLNNLIRIYRLSGTNTQNEFANLFDSAVKLFETATIHEIDKLLKSLVCSPRLLFEMIIIDNLKNKIFRILNLYNKKGVCDCKKINSLTKRIIEEIERLKEEYNRKVKINVSKIVKNVVDFHSLALEGKIKFYAEIEGSLFAPVNPHEINKIIDNLLQNAIAAVESSEKPVIKVYLKKNREFIEFVIIDNGKGIETEKTEMIFTPNYSTKERGGLGLYETKKIVEKYLGEITYSRLNEMSIFKVIIRGAI